MSEQRIESLRRLVDAAPSDPRARLFLAHELERARRWAEAAREYAAYIDLGAGDEGAACKSLGLCLERTGDRAGAAEAYRRGLRAAHAHGHASLADEIEERLADLES